MVTYRYMPTDPDAQHYWFRARDGDTFRALVDWCRSEFGPDDHPNVGVRWSFDSAEYLFLTDPHDATALRLRWC